VNDTCDDDCRKRRDEQSGEPVLEWSMTFIVEIQKLLVVVGMFKR
jgi:hypothetical protein